MPLKRRFSRIRPSLRFAVMSLLILYPFFSQYDVFAQTPLPLDYLFIEESGENQPQADDQDEKGPAAQIFCLETSIAATATAEQFLRISTCTPSPNRSGSILRC
jgi:hypothetical protein